MKEPARGEASDERREKELGERVGARIRYIRVARDMTQEELAQRMGTKRPAVSNWENGINIPSFPTLAKLASTFSVPIRHLLGPETEFDPDVSAAEEIASSIPELDRRIRILDGLDALGEDGHHLVGTTMDLFGRLADLAEMPHEHSGLSGLARTVRQSLRLAQQLLRREDSRRMETFLREVQVDVSMDTPLDRFVNLYLNFVPPPGYAELFELLLTKQKIVAITGPPGSGKTYLGLRLLMDLAQESHRPFWLSGSIRAASHTHGGGARMPALLRSGRAAFLDDPTEPETGYRALRHFACEPDAAIRMVQGQDGRLIVAIGTEELAANPALSDALAPYLWSVEGRYGDAELARMLAKHGKTYHPQLRDQVLTNTHDLDSPHAIERSLAVTNDSRQLMRRRVATITRSGLEHLMQDDYATLGEAEQTLLMLVHLMPLPYADIARAFAHLDPRDGGGDATDADAVVSRLHHWVSLCHHDTVRLIGFAHPAYRIVVDAAANSPRDSRRMVSRIVEYLVAGGAYEQLIAMDIAARLDYPAKYLASADLAIVRAAGALIERAADLPRAVSEPLLKSLEQPLGLQAISAARSLRDLGAQVPADIADTVKQAIDDPLTHRLIEISATPTGDPMPTLGEASDRGTVEQKILAAQTAMTVFAGEHARGLTGLLSALAQDGDASVSRATQRAVTDGVHMVPEGFRGRLLSVV